MKSQHCCKTLPVCLQTGSISVGSYGDVTLLTNSATAVTLTAAPLSGCGTTTAISGTTTVYPNLNPVELDVDAGEAFGLQVQSQTAEVATPAALQVGSTFDMDIRVNSTSSPLIAFEVSPHWLGALLWAGSVHARGVKCLQWHLCTALHMPE